MALQIFVSPTKYVTKVAVDFGHGFLDPCRGTPLSPPANNIRKQSKEGNEPHRPKDLGTNIIFDWPRRKAATESVRAALARDSGAQVTLPGRDGSFHRAHHPSSERPAPIEDSLSLFESCRHANISHD
jgi:hypothetical protein